ncbi:MAG: 4a-hydroxytetrahydrobiopterin dehydratase [Bacteroidia bacterium]|nr:4a-hydroxytetrahydrobiopterin dehydratase [Bacteroidia bacterium]
MWKEENNRLKAHFEFRDFGHAFTFMMRVAFIAERMNHHPEWSNSWNVVDISLCTHDAGDIVTEKDRRLADAIEQVFSEMK